MSSENPISSISSKLNPGLRQIHDLQAGLLSKTKKQLDIASSEISSRVTALSKQLKETEAAVAASPKDKELNATLIGKKRELKELVKAQKKLIELGQKTRTQSNSAAVKLASKAADYLYELGQQLDYSEVQQTREAYERLRADVSHVKFAVDRLKTKLSASEEEIAPTGKEGEEGFLAIAKATSDKTRGLFATLKAKKKELSKTVTSTEQAVQKLATLTTKGNTLSKKNLDDAIAYSEQVFALEDDLTTQEAITKDHKENLELLLQPKMPQQFAYEGDSATAINQSRNEILKKYQNQLEKTYGEALKNPMASHEEYNTKAKEIIEQAETEIQYVEESWPHTNPWQGEILGSLKFSLDRYTDNSTYKTLSEEIRKTFEDNISAIKEKYEKDPANTPAKEKQLGKELRSEFSGVRLKIRELDQIQSTYDDSMRILDFLKGVAERANVANIQYVRDGIETLKQQITAKYESNRDKIRNGKKIPTTEGELSAAFAKEIESLKTESLKQLFAKDIESTPKFIQALRDKTYKMRAQAKAKNESDSVASANKMLERLSAAELNFRNAIRNIGSNEKEKVINEDTFSIFSFATPKSREYFERQLRWEGEQAVKKDKHDLTIQETRKAIIHAKSIQDRLNSMDPKEVNAALIAAGTIVQGSGYDPYQFLKERIAKQLEQWKYRLNVPFRLYESVIQPEKVQKELKGLQIERDLKYIEDAMKNRQVNEDNMKRVQAAIEKSIPLAEAHLAALREMQNDLSARKNLILKSMNNDCETYISTLDQNLAVFKEIQKNKTFARANAESFEKFIKDINHQTNIYLRLSGSAIRVAE